MTEVAMKIKVPAEIRGMCLVEQSHMEWFMSATETSITRKDIEAFTESAASSWGVQASAQATGDPFWDGEDSKWYRPYNVARAADGTGVLVISVQGSLWAGMTGQFGNYVTGYEYITAAVRRGVADTTIKAIVLDINSPGGMVRGCSECGDAIAAAAKVKPVIAYAADCAASAAYWLASQSTQIHVSTTGEVGSIGVITGHFDESDWLKGIGVKYTPIFAGERKADFSPYLTLTDEAKAGMQKRINAVYAEFISATARGRGMNGSDIRNTQAAMFAAKKSVRIGLADRVSTRAQVMAAALGEKLEVQAEDENDNKGSDMTDKTEDKTQATAPAPAVDATAAVAAAMARAQEILGCDEAKGREKLAHAFAFDADFAALPVAKVKTLLANAAAAAPAADTPAPNALDAAMMNTPNPNLGAGADAETIDPVLAASLGLTRK